MLIHFPESFFVFDAFDLNNGKLRPSKKQVARSCKCGWPLGCGVASAVSQNRSQVMLWFLDGI